MARERSAGSMLVCGVCLAAVTAAACASSTAAGDPGGASVVVTAARVTPWRDEALAAYSLIHDDLCAGAEGILGHAVPELRARGLRAGLATVAGSCEQSGIAARLPGLVAEGFEIVNHSYSHPHITPEVAPREVVEAKRLLESYSGQPVTFFAFPFDDYNDATIGLVGVAGHLGARAGGAGLNTADFPDPLRVRFEAFGPYSSYGNGPDSLDRYVDAAVAAGGWALRECHGVADTSWEPVPLGSYRAHLDRVSGQVAAHQVWMATPSTVARYRLARQRCGPPRIEGALVSFATSESCSELRSELTLALTLAGEATGIRVSAGGQELATRRGRSGEWIVTVDPRLPVEVLPAEVSLQTP